MNIPNKPSYKIIRWAANRMKRCVGSNQMWPTFTGYPNRYQRWWDSIFSEISLTKPSVAITINLAARVSTVVWITYINLSLFIYLLQWIALSSVLMFFCLFKYGAVKAQVCFSWVQSMFKSINRTAQFTRYTRTSRAYFVNQDFRYVLWGRLL